MRFTDFVPGVSYAPARLRAEQVLAEREARGVHQPMLDIYQLKAEAEHLGVRLRDWRCMESILIKQQEARARGGFKASR